jgi:hypothetical protein
MNIILLLILIFLVFFLLFILFKGKQKDSSSSPPLPKYISIPNYEVLILENLLSQSECKELIQLAKNNKMDPSQVVSDKSTSDYDLDSRNSFQVWMDAKTNPILSKISKKSQEITGYPYVKL